MTRRRRVRERKLFNRARRLNLYFGGGETWLYIVMVKGKRAGRLRKGMGK